MPKFWITYTAKARQGLRPFRPDHMVPASRYVLDGEWFIFTDDSSDGVPHRVLEVLAGDVARVERIEDWLAEERKRVESEAYRRALN